MYVGLYRRQARVQRREYMYKQGLRLFIQTFRQTHKTNTISIIRYLHIDKMSNVVMITLKSGASAEELEKYALNLMSCACERANLEIVRRRQPSTKAARSRMKAS